jgi:hypothetical protein
MNPTPDDGAQAFTRDKLTAQMDLASTQMRQIRAIMAGKDYDAELTAETAAREKSEAKLAALVVPDETLQPETIAELRAKLAEAEKTIRAVSMERDAFISQAETERDSAGVAEDCVRALQQIIADRAAERDAAIRERDEYKSRLLRDGESAAKSLGDLAEEIMRERKRSESAEAERDAHAATIARLLGVLELIALPKRPDGTYNRSREACEQLARKAIAAIAAIAANPELT